MNANSAEKVSRIIKEKISEVGISVHALEKKAGLKQSAIQNILYGKSKKPSLHIIQSIAQALDCTVLDLLGDQDKQSLLESAQSKDAYSKSELLWDIDLFSETLTTIHLLSKKKSMCLSKETLLYCTEEVYAYSLKNGQTKPDKHFAEWMVDKSSKT